LVGFSLTMLAGSEILKQIGSEKQSKKLFNSRKQ
jgi:hypothetical protein